MRNENIPRARLEPATFRFQLSRNHLSKIAPSCKRLYLQPNALPIELSRDSKQKNYGLLINFVVKHLTSTEKVNIFLKCLELFSLMNTKNNTENMENEEHIAVLSFDNNPNIGLYAFATDSYCLIGEDIPQQAEDKIAKTLKVPTHRISIAGTSLVGVFCTGNSNKLLVPYIIQPHEIKLLEKLGIEFAIIKSRITAIGNNITANDKGALISTEFSDEVKDLISDELSVPVKKAKISEMNNIGSCLVANNKGGLVHRDVKGFELELLEDTLKVEVLDGTINLGNPYVKSGIIANSKGLIVGSHSGGPEITNADMALGFLEFDE